MKRSVLAIIIAAVVLVVAGCAFQTPYFVAFGDAITGMCEQVTTNDSALKSDLESAGWEQGSCADNGFAGTHYCTTTDISGTTSYEISIYWGSSFTPTDIQTVCTSSGWTYH